VTIIREIEARSVLNVSKIFDYTVNPYAGCAHSCTYCYARFMKRFTGRPEPCGEFVDVKINAPALLSREILRKKRGTVWVSGVCDPYQPVEAEYQVTRRCIEIIADHGWPLVVQTRSPLVLRDLHILASGEEVEVGLSVTTADDTVRRLFEPKAPPIPRRIEALERLHSAGVKTFAMIAPLLPGAEGLPALLEGKVDRILVDRMNYNYGAWVYRRHGLEGFRSEDFYQAASRGLGRAFLAAGIPCDAVG
jgi:DNA repair photolyase